MSYLFPINSFVQAAPAPADCNCHQNITSCYPVYDVQDVGFQFWHITGGAGYNYAIQLVKDGIEVGARVVVSSIEVERPELDPVFPVRLVFVTSINTTGFADVINDGECFSIRLYATRYEPTVETVLFNTTCFYRITNPCFSSLIAYACNENSFGFAYYILIDGDNAVEGYYNKIRLPFYIRQPQFPTKRNVFIKSNGERKKLSARVSTEYEGITDYMPKDFHEKFVIAMEHDIFKITNIDSGYSNQPFSQEGAYEINWQDFLDYPTAPAKFKLMLTPYNNVNSNCK